MRTVFLLIAGVLAGFSAGTVQAQTTSPYNTWIEKATAAYQKGLYLESAWAYGRAFTADVTTDDPWTDRYHAASAWAKAGRADSAMSQLWHLARHTGYQDFAELELDEAFSVLRENNGWRPLLAQIRRNRQNSDPATDTALAERLARMFVLDQRYRLRLEAYPHGASGRIPEAARLVDSMRMTDSIHVLFVDSLLQESGWPGAAQIGRRGVNTVFIILQHADTATQYRYHELLRQAAASGDLPAADLAMFEDRVALSRGGEQVYGTQIICDQQGCRVDRLNDPLHVDERRKAVGLGQLADYLKDWNITWNAQEYESTRKAATVK